MFSFYTLGKRPLNAPSPTVSHNNEKKELSSVGRGLEEDLYGSLYDNIFLRGHIGRSPNLFNRVISTRILFFSADEERPVDQGKQQFVPGYLALFL